MNGIGVEWDPTEARRLLERAAPYSAFARTLLARIQETEGVIRLNGCLTTMPSGAGAGGEKQREASRDSNQDFQREQAEEVFHRQAPLAVRRKCIGERDQKARPRETHRSRANTMLLAPVPCTYSRRSRTLSKAL